MIELQYEDANFPNMLKQIDNPPLKIYVEGNINILNDYSIAVIGSRDCTNYGKIWCEKFVKGLLEYDLVIVSGMAKGIDGIAHKAAIKYGGKTIAVLPSGFNNIYPKENIGLYKEIIDLGGAVISEYAPNVKADSDKFLQRNRIVSGLALGTLVIEAEARSGTSVTARITREHNKKVFCIPGNLGNGKSIGTNMLIQSGDTLVLTVEDIVQNYDFLSKIHAINQISTNSVQSEYRGIFDLLSDTPMDFDEIVKKSNLKVSEISSKLTMLELDGKVKRLPGNNWIRM